VFEWIQRALVRADSALSSEFYYFFFYLKTKYISQLNQV